MMSLVCGVCLVCVLILVQLYYIYVFMCCVRACMCVCV